MERQRMMMMTEAFVLPMIGLLVMIFVSAVWLKQGNPFERHRLETCRAEVAEVLEYNETKATDITAREVSEYCEAVLQNHQ